MLLTIETIITSLAQEITSADIDNEFMPSVINQNTTRYNHVQGILKVLHRQERP